MPEYALVQDDLLAKRLYWLLRLTWGGLVLHWATEPVEITDGSDTRVHHGGLRLAFDRKLELFSTSPPLLSISPAPLFLPADTELDIPTLIERGYALVHAEAELSLWLEGDAYNRRQVQVVGRVRFPDYGENEDGLAFTITPEQVGDAADIPEPQSLITATTFPDAAESDSGRYLPEVFGKPGFTTTSVVGINGGSPAYVVDTTNDYAAIAAHAVQSTTVDVINVTQLEESALAVSEGTDALGRLYSYVNYSGETTWGDDDELHVRWNDRSGARPNSTRTAALEGAGEIISHYLKRAGIRVDRQRFDSARDELNRYKLAGYMDKPGDLWVWIRTKVLPLLPVSLVHGPEGLYPVVWNRNVKAADVRAELTEGLSLSRVGRVRFSRRGFGNEIRIGYRPRSDNGQPSRWFTLTGRDVAGDDPLVQTTALLRASVNSYGLRPRDPLVTRLIHEDATARLVAFWMAAAYGYPWREVEYENPSLEWAFLPPGSPVTITDSGMQWTNRVAWLRRVAWANTLPTLELVLIEQPARDARPSG